MVKETVKIVNSQGFHMRPASMFAKEMGEFASEVNLSVRGSNVNGKSLMNIIAACIKFGDEVEVSCQGADEDVALAKAVELINSGLGEE